MFFFLQKKSFTLLLLLLGIIAGFYSLAQMTKESAPEIVISIVRVQTLYPGASPLQVEESVTNIIENSLVGGIKNVKSVTSNSGQSVSSIILEFDSGVDIREALDDVQNKVDGVVGDLPSDAQEPLVQQIKFNDEPIYIFAMTSREPLTNLRAQADAIEDEILKVKGVSRVEVSGIPEREINIVLDNTKLAQFGLNANDVSRAIQFADRSIPPGSIEINEREYGLYFDTGVEKTEDLENIIISEKNGSYVFVRDIALRIEDGLAESSSLSRVTLSEKPAQQAVIFSVFKQTGGDITKLVRDVKKQTNGFIKESGSVDTEFVTTFDAAGEIQKSLRDLTSSGVQAVLIVLLVLILGLGVREALTASMAIPLSFVLAFIGMLATGSTINFVSLFALIIVIGILIDSAIVIVEGISDSLAEGDTFMLSSQKALQTFGKPVIAGTFTTISVFVPLLLLSGITGQFIASIPKAVIVVLIASLIVALIFIPLIAGWLFRFKFTEPKWLTQGREKTFTYIGAKYEQLLRFVLSSRKVKVKFLALLTILFIGSFVLVGSGLIKSEFFPSDAPESLYVDIEVPVQTTLEETARQVEDVESFIMSVPHVSSITTTVGSGSFFSEGGSGSNYANITVDFPDKKYGDGIAQTLRGHFKTYTDKEVTLVVPEGGPPVGAPVVLKFVGPDLGELSRVTQQAADILREIPGTTEVTTTIDEGATDISLRVRPDRLAQVGLTAFDVSQIINATVSGVETSKIRYAGYGDVDVFVKVALNAQARDHTQTNEITFDVLKTLPVQTPRQGEVLLGSLIEEDLRQAASVIRHEEGLRVFSASSNLLPDFVANDVFDSFNERTEEIGIPDDVELIVGGEADEGAEAVAELGAMLIFGILLVIFVLVFQFNSFSQTAIIMSVVPLGLIGVLWGIFIIGSTLSFTAMLGFIALVGVVINDSIILVDVMNTLVAKGDENPVINGALSRLRPVILTTATTVFGMIPLLYVSKVWVPFAFAVITGLTFATILTLILIPMLYQKFGIKKK